MNFLFLENPPIIEFIFPVALLLPVILAFLTVDYYEALEDVGSQKTEDEPVASGFDQAERKMGHSRLSEESEINKICSLELPEIIDRLPYDSWFNRSFTREKDLWRFTFKSNSIFKHFYASALGSSPQEAFLIAKYGLNQQIKNWHQTRFHGLPETATPGELSIRTMAPRVLIVDDDVDLALAMEAAIKKLGCTTEVVTHHEGLHRKMVSGFADYIVLDWKLGDEVTADKVVTNAIRLLDTFSDLREKFAEKRPRVITHSALDRSQVRLPSTSEGYFFHLDHWQKPMPFSEVIRRTSNLLEMNLSEGGVA